MSENVNKAVTDAEWEARNLRRQERREELEPKLIELQHKAEAAYSFLRPKAAHVGSVEMDHPLRHQQVRGYDPVTRGAGGVLADYLMINLGEGRHITLYYNYDRRDNYEWEFKDKNPVDDKLYNETTVRTLERPSRDGLFTNFEVSRYRYGTPKGHGDMHDDFVSSYFDDYADADTYITAFSEALDEAVQRFGEMPTISTAF